jgi:hypothetical protein
MLAAIECVSLMRVLPMAPTRAGDIVIPIRTGPRSTQYDASRGRLDRDCVREKAEQNQTVRFN